MIIDKRNFWEGNETSKLFLEHLLISAFQEESSIRNIDLTSVFVKRDLLSRVRNRVITQLIPRRSFDIRSQWEFGITPPKNSHDLTVWYTGENLRPPHNYDLTLSFDPDDLKQGNIYLPYWFTLFGEIPEFSNSKNVPIESFLSPRKMYPNQSKFCAVVINNPHPLRLRAIRELERLGEVDVFGRAIGRPVSDKVKLLSNYRFNLCFENDLYPGYVTEKPFDAWLAGSVPLYWGNTEDTFLNQNAIVNLATFKSMASYIDHVQELDSDKELRELVISAPILKNVPNILSIIETVRKIVS